MKFQMSILPVAVFTAVLPLSGGAIDQPAAYHIQQPILTNCLVGCSPERIDRPPIILLPM